MSLPLQQNLATTSELHIARPIAPGRDADQSLMSERLAKLDIPTLARDFLRGTIRDQVSVEDLALDQLVAIARSRRHPELDTLCSAIDANRSVLAMQRTLNIPSVSETALRHALQNLAPEQRRGADELFSRAIHRIRNETTYLAPLESNGIADALERRNFFGQMYDRFVWTSRADKNTYAGGQYHAALGFVSLKVEVDSGAFKDTMLFCWPTLAATGFLPSAVHTLEHELHHSDQHRDGLIARVLDLVPAYRFLPWIQINGELAEGTAHLLVHQAAYEPYRPSLASIYRSLTHFEFSAYRFSPERCPEEMLAIVKALYLMGTSPEEMAAIVRSTRFKTTDQVMKLLRVHETQRRETLQLKNDTDYTLALALRHAQRCCIGETDRLKAQKLAADAAAQIAGFACEAA